MKRDPDAIDLAFQKYPTPVGHVYFVQRNGWKRRTFSRKAAINSLAYFMVVDVFLLFGWPLRYPDVQMVNAANPELNHWMRGSVTQEYFCAHRRTVRRLRRILARKREIQKWYAKWRSMHDRYIKEQKELQASKPEGIR